MVGFVNNQASGSTGAAGGDFASGLTASIGQFNASQASGGDLGSSLLSAAGGALSLVPGGAAFAPLLTGITALFSKYAPKTDEAKQSADINKIAAANGITGTEAATVVAYHANHSSDHFNDLAAYVANEQPSRFDSLLAEYNSSNPPQRITVGSLQRAADQVASAQQKLITTALTTQGFAATATGQQFVSSLQQLPAQQVVGNQGQTVGDILQKVLDGAVKGGSDAAAETAWGKKFKWSYIQDWLKENQLLAFFLTIIAGLGLLTIVNIARGKHGKISI